MGYEALVMGVGAIVVAGLIYWAQQDRHARERAASEREERIDAFVATYRRRHPGGAGLHNLIEAGVLALRNDKEIREGCERIHIASNMHPIPASYLEVMSTVDLQAFFREFSGRIHEMGGATAVRTLVESLQGTRGDA